MLRFTLFILITVLQLLAYDNYDKREIETYRSDNLKFIFSQKISKELNSKDFLDLTLELKTLHFSQKIKNYKHDVSNPKAKYIYFDKKNNILAVLIGWRMKSPDTDGEFYQLDIFKYSQNTFIELKEYSKNDYDGWLRDGNNQKNFIYKIEKEILNYLSKIRINDNQVKVLFSKQALYKTPPTKTKMYLIKGDKVEILEEKDDWLYILYRNFK